MEIHYLNVWDDIECAGFNSQEYGLLKFGSCEIANQYAKILCERFLYSVDISTISRLVIMSAPYITLPNPASLLADRIGKELLKLFFLRKGFREIGVVHIHKDKHFKSEYAQLTLRERVFLYKDICLYIDEKISGATVLYIDDIKTTGSTESKCLSFFKEQGVACVYSLHLIDISQSGGAEYPSIEGILNRSAITNLHDVQIFFENGGYPVTSSMCRFVLSYPDITAIWEFFNALPKEIVQEFYRGSMGDGYPDMIVFKEGFLKLQNVYKNC